MAPDLIRILYCMSIIGLTNLLCNIPSTATSIDYKGDYVENAANEGMDSYRLAIDHMEIRPDR